MKTKKPSKQLSSEELADSIVFPITLTGAQKKEAAEQLAAARKKSQKEITDNDRISLQLFQLKFPLENYFENKDFNPELTFGYFLK